MILLDTNVVSAVMRDDPIVTAWLGAQARASVWTTTVSLFELQYGLELMPEGRRKSDYVARFSVMLKALEGRIRSFDVAAALAAASLQKQRVRAGRKVELGDALIAGIAIACRASICTRNVRHFEDAGVTILNPWAETV